MSVRHGGPRHTVSTPMSHQLLMRLREKKKKKNNSVQGWERALGKQGQREHRGKRRQEVRAGVIKARTSEDDE